MVNASARQCLRLFWLMGAVLLDCAVQTVKTMVVGMMASALYRQRMLRCWLHCIATVPFVYARAQLAGRVRTG